VSSSVRSTIGIGRASANRPKAPAFPQSEPEYRVVRAACRPRVGVDRPNAATVPVEATNGCRHRQHGRLLGENLGCVLGVRSVHPIGARPRARVRRVVVRTGVALESNRTWGAWWAALVVLALVLRVALVLATPHFVPSGDPADYQRNAVSIATGHGMAVTQIASPGSPSAFRPPAYPYLLGGLYAIVGIHASAGRLLSALLGAATVALVLLLAARFWERQWALVAGGVAAVYPPLIALNATLLSESLFIPLLLAATLAMERIAHSRRYVRWCAATGLVCGLAASTRSVGLLWLLPAVVVALQTGSGWRRSVGGVAAMIATMLVVLLPWTIRNAETLHAFVPLNTEDGFTLAGEYNAQAGTAGPFHAVWLDPLDVPSLKPVFADLATTSHGHFTEAQEDIALRSAGLRYMRDHPGEIAVSVWLNSLRMLNLGINHGFTTSTAYREMNLPSSLWTITSLAAQLIALGALLGLGLTALQIVRIDAGPWWLWAMPALTIAATVLTSGTPRYRTPADPFLILLAMLTARAVLARWGRTTTQ
jgi:4-amino-4-deoxy-L-arabinose transferase-like glycosyltransferase